MAEKDRRSTEDEYRVVHAQAREERFSDAGYIPQSEAPEIRSARFTPPPAPKPEKKRRGISAGTVVAMCLICGVLGGVVGGIGVGWYMTRISPAEVVREIIDPTALTPEESAVPVPEEKARSAASAESVMGILGETVSPSVARYYDMAQGVYVWSVDAGSAAESAGLHSGDIITALDETPVLSVEELRAAESAFAYGERGTLTVCRGEEYMEIEIALGGVE